VGAAIAFLPTSPTVAYSTSAAAFTPLTAQRSASVKLNIAEERLQSIKACTIAAASGTLASVPVFGVDKGIHTTTDLLFSVGMLAPELALFGAVYRCTVRSDYNDPLKMGAVGAFAICRALASLPISGKWTPELTNQLFVSLGEGAVAFGIAAAAIEFAWSRGYAYPLEGTSRALSECGYDSYGYQGYDNGYGRDGYGSGYGSNTGYGNGYGDGGSGDNPGSNSYGNGNNAGGYSFGGSNSNQGRGNFDQGRGNYNQGGGQSYGGQGYGEQSYGGQSYSGQSYGDRGQQQGYGSQQSYGDRGVVTPTRPAMAPSGPSSGPSSSPSSGPSSGGDSGGSGLSPYEEYLRRRDSR